MSPERWSRKDLLGIADLSTDEIELLLDTAESFREVAERPIKKVPTLRGKTVLNLFFEASTRTRSSFEIAEKRMSADAINFSTLVFFAEQGRESARHDPQPRGDGARHHRHAPLASARSAPALAQRIESSVINAGDGAHEHPDAGAP